MSPLLMAMELSLINVHYAVEMHKNDSAGRRRMTERMVTVERRISSIETSESVETIALLSSPLMVVVVELDRPSHLAPTFLVNSTFSKKKWGGGRVNDRRHNDA